jgi:hypothetical protein
LLLGGFALWGFDGDVVRASLHHVVLHRAEVVLDQSVVGAVRQRNVLRIEVLDDGIKADIGDLSAGDVLARARAAAQAGDSSFEMVE